MGKKGVINNEDEQKFLEEIMRQSDAMALGKTPSEIKEKENIEKPDKRLQSYENTYLKPTCIIGRNGKTIYIREEYHKRISAILSASPKKLNMSLFAYIDNILTEHFDKHWETIIVYIQEKQKQMFNQK